MKKLYLVMNTFSGSYFEENYSRNIGHECINFFMPNDIGEKILIWFNPDGKFNPEYKSGYTITLLMVTNYSAEKNKYRILGLAKDCQIIEGVTVGGKKKEKKFERYNIFKEKYGLAKYGKKTIEEIFQDNLYHGKIEEKDTLATFWVLPENMYVPKSNKEIIKMKKEDNAKDFNLKNEMNESPAINLNLARMRRYIKDTKDIKQIEEIINNIEWEQLVLEKKNELPYYPRNKEYYKNNTLFALTGTEKNEHVISNMIASSLKKSPELLTNFIEELNKAFKKSPNEEHNKKSIEIIQGQNVDCIRENKYVDLTLLVNEYTIIIENKIDSNIAESGYDDYEKTKRQILKSLKEFDLEEKEMDQYLITAGFTKEKVEKYKNQCCQLTKYYIQTQVDALINDKDKIRFFIFCYFLNIMKKSLQMMQLINGYMVINMY